jgi:hypothetical protein
LDFGRCGVIDDAASFEAQVLEIAGDNRMLPEFLDDGLELGQGTDSRQCWHIGGPHGATEAGQQKSAATSPSQDCLFYQVATTALASSQSDFPVYLRRNLPPSDPDAKMKHAHLFQDFLRSSNPPEPDSSGWPTSHSDRCLR